MAAAHGGFARREKGGRRGGVDMGVPGGNLNLDGGFNAIANGWRVSGGIGRCVAGRRRRGMANWKSTMGRDAD